MPREDAHVKARRLLVEGRVRLLNVSDADSEVSAEVRGDTARIYLVSHDRQDGWQCDCKAYGVCSHVRAVMLVVIIR